MANPNTAIFPTRAATDNDLFVASDKVSTTTTSPVGAGDLSINVVSTTGINFPTIINIDNEQIACTSATSTVITVATNGRGFNGTTAATHTNGATVNCFVDSYYTNQVNAEVKAIENLLIGSSAISSSSYDFPAQTPGGTLTATIGASVTLSPVPLGVNASDTGHYLYISSGTGTAEAVLITGGTAVAGSASGTVQFTPANNHSGAWTIRSASAGIAESAQDNNGGIINIPKGTLNIYGPLSIQQKTTLRGAGSASTILTRKFAGAQHMITLTNASAEHLGFATGAGLLLTISGGFIFMTGADAYLLDLRNTDIDPTNCSARFITLSSAARVYLDTIFLGEGTGSQIYFTASGGNLNNITGGGTATNQIAVTFESGNMNASNWVIQLTGSNAIALAVTPTGTNQASECVFNNITLDSAGAAGLWIVAGSGVVGGITFSDFRISVLGVPVAISGANNISLNNIDVAVVNSAISPGQVRIISGTDIKINQLNVISGSGVTGYRGVVISESGLTVNGLIISDSIIGQLLIGGSDTVGCNNGVYLTASASDNITIVGNIIGGTVPFTDLATGINKTYADNVGVDNIIPAVASAATIAIPVNPIFTVTGTTGVGTVTCTKGKGASGLLVTTSGVVTFTAGATIGNTLATVQNVPVLWYWDGTKIWLK